MNTTILPLSSRKKGRIVCGSCRRHWLVCAIFICFVGVVEFLLFNLHPILLLSSTPLSISTEHSYKYKCDVYMAESALPRGGLGVFTGVALSTNELVKASPDVCLYVADASVKNGTEYGSHTWQDYRFGAQWLGGSNTRAECMGIVTLFNSMSVSDLASARPSADRSLIHTNAGLNRKTSPGAGAISQYYGATATATRNLVPGSELMLLHGGFGKSTYAPDDPAGEPHRSPVWLQRHGFCLDHIVVKTATDPSMGRGAFAKRSIHSGIVVSPAPVQIFRDRAAFTNSKSGLEEVRSASREACNAKSNTSLHAHPQLIVNYSFQPKDSPFLIFPYGAGFGLINHNRCGAKRPCSINNPSFANRFARHLARR